VREILLDTQETHPPAGQEEGCFGFENLGKPEAKTKNPLSIIGCTHKKIYICFNAADRQAVDPVDGKETKRAMEEAVPAPT